MIVNHCMDCSKVPHHFDINAAPMGWDNPQIWWKKVDMSECRGGAAAAGGGGGYLKMEESGNATIAEGVSGMAGADTGAGGDVRTLSKSTKGVVGGGRKLLENAAEEPAQDLAATDPATQDNALQDNSGSGTVENPPSSNPPPSSSPSSTFSTLISSTPTPSTPTSSTSSTPPPSPSNPVPKRRCKRFKAQQHPKARRTHQHSQ